MKKGAKRNQIISELLHVTDEEFTDEELIHQLIATEVTKNADKDEHMTFGQRAADAVARFAGSWAFIFSFACVLILWMVVNAILATKAFDPYPFILLNLVLSCVAAVQAPLIMMSQNRQEEKDRNRAENDYKVNLKIEIMIEDLYDKVNAILAKQSQIEKLLTQEKAEDEKTKK